MRITRPSSLALIHTFTEVGVHTVPHMAHDFRGATGTGTIAILGGQPNLGPVAVPSASVLSGPSPRRRGAMFPVRRNARMRLRGAQP